MGRTLEKINKKFLEPEGNTSIAAGALFGVSSVAFVCPLCIGASALLVADGVRKKLKW